MFFRQNLVHARGPLNITAPARLSSCQDAGRTFGVTANDVGRMLETVNKIDLLLDCFQRGKRRSQLHLGTIAFTPPLRWMNPVTKKEETKTLRPDNLILDTEQLA